MMAGAWPGDPLILMVLGILALGALAVLLDGLRIGRRNPEGRDMEGAFAAPAHASDPVSQMAAIHRVMAVIEFDLQGRILTANQNFLDLFGCRLEEIRGQPHSIFCPPGVAHSQDYQELWERLRRGEHETGEYRRLALDGRELWVQASYHPIFPPAGGPGKVVKFASDISFHREMEAELLEAKERAERAAAARSAFLANMSHEIRTPMNAIIGFTELLLGSRLDDTQRRHLQTVQHSARSLLALLNDILDTAKLERGVVELEAVDFSLRELVERICALLRPNATAKGLTLSLHYAAELGEGFRGDPLRIQQVLLNLLGNAIKFTPQGEVSLHVQAEGEQVCLAVRDTGIGIAADRLQKIFEPFAQADASMSRRFGGTGLGTTIARQLVELMGGRIEVHSRPGEGSTFRITLPLPAAQALPRQAVPSLPHLPPLHILVVDDVEQNVELLALGLGRLGHRIGTARDGAQALAALAGGRFDLVLMDVQMPGVDGLAASRQWRAHEQAHGLPRTPLIALTASVLESDRLAAREAGMDGFAAKPVELERLLDEIVRVTGIAPAQAGVEPGAASMAVAACPLADSCRATACTSASCPLVEVPVLLERLARVWRRGELDDLALRQLLARLDPQGNSASLAALVGAVDEFEFDRALQLLEVLRSRLETLPEGQPA
ncbi:PAS domain-containing hybrid sensor histidine kinase/response regulator [Pseudomonas sp. AN-1]|uniref:PAS domain-containing hybrid sensor histidine kinase/response regulator n=1 Tax=Pseudomonas sp. AN-1 TaxID=3096605 RepID=UPI002A6AF105|nr:ATP-binding protein [Pseudomonas sp. AN-1]WPP46828.1 ATP-binding protein [Pseudomonas sp. AN-1]